MTKFFIYALASLFAIVYFICFSCSPKKLSEIGTNSDSVNLNVSPRINQFEELDTLSQFKNYFKSRGTRIPLALCCNYLEIDNYEQIYSDCYSYDMFEHQNFTLFIVKLKCMAGGMCEEMHLFIFDKNGFKAELVIGMNISDQSFRKKVDYKFIDDQTIELKIHNQEYKDEQLTNDSTYFEYFSIDTNTGLIKKAEKH